MDEALSHLVLIYPMASLPTSFQSNPLIKHSKIYSNQTPIHFKVASLAIFFPYIYVYIF